MIWFWTQINLVATLILNGLIWTIQLVHYPLFARVGAEHFVDYEREHCQRISWLVGPLMVAELASAIALSQLRPGPLTQLGLGLVVGIWIYTGVLFGPLHGRLSQRQDRGDLDRLVRLNWGRTLAWTLRIPLAILLAA